MSRLRVLGGPVAILPAIERGASAAAGAALWPNPAFERDRPRKAAAGPSTSRYAASNRPAANHADNP